MTEPVWSYRNSFLKDFDLENKSVIDFGCGDKSICNYITFKNYIGIDLMPPADYIIDFNKDFTIPVKADTGLVLGVLEYLDSPYNFISAIKDSCNNFIFMILDVNKTKTHHGWKQVYNSLTLSTLLQSHFNNIETHKINKYVLAVCTK